MEPQALDFQKSYDNLTILHDVCRSKDKFTIMLIFNKSYDNLINSLKSVKIRL